MDYICTNLLCIHKLENNYGITIFLPRIGGADLSDDTTTLLSYYTKDTPGSSGASTETVTASNEQVTPSDTATKSQVVTVSRYDLKFFTCEKVLRLDKYKCFGKFQKLRM